MSEKEMFPPEPPVAIDNLGIQCQGPALAEILGAHFPPPPPKPPQEVLAPHMPPPKRVKGPILKLGGGRRP